MSLNLDVSAQVTHDGLSDDDTNPQERGSEGVVLTFHPEILWPAHNGRSPGGTFIQRLRDVRHTHSGQQAFNQHFVAYSKRTSPRSLLVDPSAKRDVLFRGDLDARIDIVRSDIIDYMAVNGVLLVLATLHMRDILLAIEMRHCCFLRVYRFRSLMDSLEVAIAMAPVLVLYITGRQALVPRRAQHSGEPWRPGLLPYLLLLLSRCTNIHGTSSENRTSQVVLFSGPYIHRARKAGRTRVPLLIIPSETRDWYSGYRGGYTGYGKRAFERQCYREIAN